MSFNWYSLDDNSKYAPAIVEGITASELDECCGHCVDARGYYYHVGAPVNDSLISGFTSALANSRDAGLLY